MQNVDGFISNRLVTGGPGPDRRFVEFASNPAIAMPTPAVRFTHKSPDSSSLLTRYVCPGCKSSAAVDMGTEPTATIVDAVDPLAVAKWFSAHDTCVRGAKPK